MSTYNLHRFSTPEKLTGIDSMLLVKFLDHYREFFEEQGLLIPTPGHMATIDFECLAWILMNPRADQPSEVVSALFLVHEMATDGASERLLDAAHEASLELSLPEEPSAADISIAVWLVDEAIHRELHAETLMFARESFLHFVSDAKDQDHQHSDERVPIPDKSKIRELEDELVQECRKLQRGHRVCVEPSEHGDEIWFVIRHGELFRRDNALEGEDPTTLVWRPEAFDVVIFTRWDRGLRVNCKSTKLTKAIRKSFGRVLLEDSDAFSHNAIYTLEPLRMKGVNALNHADVPGICNITLIELGIRFDGAFKEVHTLRATDLFAANEQRGTSIPRFGEYSSAIFEVEFDDGSPPRQVRIQPPNKTRFGRSTDHSRIDAWMRKRGFFQIPREFALKVPASHWDAIAEMHGQAATLYEWKQSLGDAPREVLALIRPTGRRGKGIRWRDGRDCRLVYHDQSGAVAIDENDQPVGAVALDEATIHSFDPDALGHQIRTALGLKKSVATSSSARGVFDIAVHKPRAGAAFSVYLLLHSNSDEIEVAVDQLIARCSAPFIVFTMSDSMVRPQLVERWKERGVWHFSVADTLRRTPERKWKSSGLARERLAGFSATVLPPTVDEPDRRVFPTPAGATWRDVHITFLTTQTVTVRIGEDVRELDCKAFDMWNRHAKRPNKQWELLIEFAKCGGVLLYEKGSDAKRPAQPQKDALTGKLKKFFRIDEDPIETIEGNWHCVFDVRYDIAE